MKGWAENKGKKKNKIKGIKKKKKQIPKTIATVGERGKFLSTAVAS